MSQASESPCLSSNISGPKLRKEKISLLSSWHDNKTNTYADLIKRTRVFQLLIILKKTTSSYSFPSVGSSFLVGKLDNI